MIVSHVLLAIGISFVFLIANVLIMLAILALSRRSDGPQGSPVAPSEQKFAGLEPSDILGWEFEYARVTASEAMEHRLTMVNFYLLVAGVVVSGVVAVVGQNTGLPKIAGTALLWLMCGIGWLYYLGIIRLRQAWHDSAKAMNQIKEFYIRHTTDVDPDALRSAFRWQEHTLPPPDKSWNVFFYSAALISFLDSLAYVAGGVLLGWDIAPSSLVPALGVMTLFGLAFFAFHMRLYIEFLQKPTTKPLSDGSGGAA